jgi:hypothetical protein
MVNFSAAWERAGNAASMVTHNRGKQVLDIVLRQFLFEQKTPPTPSLIVAIKIRLAAASQEVA